MKKIRRKLIHIFVVNSIKMMVLLLTVSILAFLLVSMSPVDPVGQYILGLQTAVSPEQRMEIEEYWGVNSFDIALRSTQRKSASCCLVKGIVKWLIFCRLASSDK